MSLELFEGMLWFHSDVLKWTPTVKQKYITDLNLLQHLVSVPLVALVAETNTKLAKFGEVTGWKKFDKVVFNEVKYDIYSRSK
jgi:hypothetical protein